VSQAKTLPPPVRAVVDVLYYLTGLGFTAYLVYYYLTGAGGPTTLAALLVPVTFILFTLDALRRGEFYPRLGWLPNGIIALVFIVLAAAVSVYITVEFHAIRTVRAGFWNATDLLLGTIMVVLVLEYARKRFFPLFILNILLILYAVYGNLVTGMFHHPGLSWERIATAMSLEIATGIYSRLPQLALTLIGAFLLVLGVLRAFGCVDSILRGATRIAARSPHALPQTAVLGSMGVASVSGSGAANAATTGTATIPAMIASGIPPARAAGIEASASLGGQLMPPVMGVSAFLMVEFMGVSYFDVVARGYAPALIFFSSVILAVYLLSVRHRVGQTAFEIEPIRVLDWINLGAFASVVIGLIALMGVLHMAPMIAAFRVFVVSGVAMLVITVGVRLRTDGRLRPAALLGPLRRFIDTYAAMVSDLTLLLATLSIMTGALVITGVPTKIGALLMTAAGINLLAMIVVAFLFGALLGTGLPPAPTYIITALVVVPPMIRVGVDPWVVHFFAFFLAVWGELTPPTSVVAAVTARIADASFLATLGHALLMCFSLFVLMAGVFTRPELVLEPGLPQLAAFGLILVATVGITFALQARFFDARLPDYATRIALAGIALLVLLHPSRELAAGLCLPVLLLAGYWVIFRRNHPGSAGRRRTPSEIVQGTTGG